MVLTKRLTRGEPVIAILFWLTAFQSVFGLALSFADGQASLPDAQTLPWLALIGLAGVMAHLCLTNALRLAPASFVGPVDFARLPVIALVGAAFYDEPVGLGLILGAAVILVANLLSLRAEAQAAGPRHCPRDTTTGSRARDVASLIDPGARLPVALSAGEILFRDEDNETYPVDDRRRGRVFRCRLRRRA